MPTLLLSLALALASGTLAADAAGGHLIFLQRAGLEVGVGADDARRDTSSLIRGPTRFAPWQVDDATWREVVDCVGELFSRFDVTVTDRDPGPSVDHIEAVFSHRPASVGKQGDQGLAPFASDCGIVDNAIVFTFVDGLDPRLICEVQAQEIAHAYGLDHALLDTDVMSYLPRRGPRSFQDHLVPCGELEPRRCGARSPGSGGCRANQNAVRLLAERLGVTAPLDGPIEVTDGCSSSGGVRASWSAVAGVLAVLLRRRTRSPST